MAIGDGSVQPKSIWDFVEFDIDQREFDRDSLYTFSSNIGLGTTLPLSAEDVLKHRFSRVEGCVYRTRDLIDMIHQIDPNGDWEFAQEMRWHGGHAEAQRVCEDKSHKGRRMLPDQAFRTSVDTICLACQMRDAPAKAPGVKPKKGKFMKAFRPQKFIVA